MDALRLRPRATQPLAQARERHIALALWAAALILYLAGLWQPALRDWDEGYTAFVAYGMVEGGLSAWWFPTLGGVAFDKPPLIHGLTALSMLAFGFGEFAVRLPAAILSSLSVPLLYLTARELRLDRRTATFSALVLLTLLPMLINGRLAMLDGPSTTFMLAMSWFLLQAPERPVMVWPAGIAFMLMCMTKGLLGPLLGFCVLLAVIWDTPSMLRSLRLWVAMAAACVVPLVWLASQAVHFGSDMVTALVWTMGAGRVTQTLYGHDGPFWYYALEIAKFCWPWAALLIPGLWMAARRRRERWAKFVLVFFVVYFGVISGAGTKLPWYAVPLYPALALACGVALSVMLDGAAAGRHAFTGLLALLAAACLFGAYFYGPHLGQSLRPAVFACVVLAAVFAAAGWQIVTKRPEATAILFGGMYAGLFLFALDRDWNWSVNDDYPVATVAGLVREHVPPASPVFILGSLERPSLAYYARRLVPVPAPDAFAPSAGTYVIAPAGQQLSFASDPVARTERWKLVLSRGSGRP
jgi:4-amino-4-deoxy-L-arabinose transferase-like glycosyltransferase